MDLNKGFTILAFSVVAATAAPARVDTPPQDRIREAALKTVRLFEKAGEEWKVPCVSCHHQGAAMMAIAAARSHGLPVNEAATQAHAAKTLKVISSSAEGVLNMSVDTFGFGYALVMADSVGLKPNIVTDLAVRHIAGVQLPNGQWPVTDARPPHSESAFTATALSVRALAAYAPPELAAVREKNFALARKWFNTAQPASTEDRAFRLLGLHWAGSPASERKGAVADLLAQQREDGGWAQEVGMASDAYATGEALMALRQGGAISGADPAFRRGVQYLLATQKEDGSWLVKSRLQSPAQISPPFFDSGFPGGKDQFISTAASAWAAIALMEALPEVADSSAPGVDYTPKGTPSWLRAAALGTVDDLKALLDGGLDPNAALSGGTTLLMAASPDVAKMRLLIERGAKATPRAINVAASYRGSAAAVRLLLQHGATVEQPMSDDPETVAVLIENGLKPAGGAALMNAVQSNNVDVVRLLAKNGWDVNTKDEQQMTPLIWASLTHRTEMVKTLLELGADRGIKDKYGYTALMHTNDIAHADRDAARLLEAQ